VLNCRHNYKNKITNTNEETIPDKVIIIFSAAFPIYFRMEIGKIYFQLPAITFS